MKFPTTVEATEDVLGWLSGLFPEYQAKALEDADLDQFLKDAKNGVIWKFEDGFAVTTIWENRLEETGIFINHLYIRKGNIKDFDQALTEYGKKFGGKWVGCYTRRDPDAFVRKVGNGWELDSYVLRRDL